MTFWKWLRYITEIGMRVDEYRYIVNSCGADVDKSRHKGPGAEVDVLGSSDVT